MIDTIEKLPPARVRARTRPVPPPPVDKNFSPTPVGIEYIRDGEIIFSFKHTTKSTKEVGGRYLYELWKRSDGGFRRHPTLLTWDQILAEHSPSSRVSRGAR